MNAKSFALWGGIAMIVMGVLALFPALSFYSQGLPSLIVESSYGMFLGFFPMNIFNKSALILFGVAGVLCSSDFLMSVRYSRVVAWVMGALALLGLFTATNTLFGYWPLFRGEVMSHGFFAVLGAYFGYIEERATHLRGATT